MNDKEKIESYRENITESLRILDEIIEIIRVTSRVLGKIFSVVSELSILNNCIPPTFSNGSTGIAITIIPMPPSHCKIALHIRIPFGALSRSVIMVDPVVVIPDILSKKASTTD